MKDSIIDFSALANVNMLYFGSYAAIPFIRNTGTPGCFTIHCYTHAMNSDVAKLLKMPGHTWAAFNYGLTWRHRCSSPRKLVLVYCSLWGWFLVIYSQQAGCCSLVPRPLPAFSLCSNDSRAIPTTMRCSVSAPDYLGTQYFYLGMCTGVPIRSYPQRLWTSCVHWH